jgi:hypothetical protein
MKKIILSALVLALTSGAAMADRFHGGHASGGARQGGVVVHSNGGHVNSGWHGNTVVHDRGGFNHGYERPYYHTHGVARGNIWFNRPVIREHYYHYGYRPSLLVENYGPREGYIFVRGDWQWNGAEWLWMPGHYEPDQAYVEVY